MDAEEHLERLDSTTIYVVHIEDYRASACSISTNAVEAIEAPLFSTNLQSDLLYPDTKDYWDAIPSPSIRSKVYHKLDRVDVEVERPRSASRALAPRPPLPQDPLNALFMLLSPEVQWDFRIENPANLLTAYPPGKSPYGFQKEGISFLVENPQALLADEMGLGKTVQAVLALRAQVHRDPQRRALCVVPKALMRSWESTFREWAPEISTVVVHGDRQVRAELARRIHHVYITNYETVKNTYCQEISQGRSRNFIAHEWVPSFDLVIIDEAQNYKNASALKSRAIRAIDRKSCWALTGTPIENRFSDLTAIWDVVDPGKSYAKMSPDEVHQTTLTRTRRRLKSDESVNLQLPEFTVRTELLELEKKQRSSYSALEKSLVSKARQIQEDARVGAITQIQAKSNALVVINKLKQCCIYDSRSRESAKLDWLVEMLNAITESTDVAADRDKVLIFTQYPKLLEDEWPFVEQLKHHNPVLYSGKHSEKQRTDAVNRIQYDDDTGIAFLSLLAAGTGLTLTRANHIVFLDAWWNPAVMQQAQARIHRIGQERKCFIYNLICKSTIEERIAEKLKEKEQKLHDYTRRLRSEQGEVLDEFNEAAFKNVVSLQDMMDVIGV